MKKDKTLLVIRVTYAAKLYSLLELKMVHLYENDLKLLTTIIFRLIVVYLS